MANKKIVVCGLRSDIGRSIEKKFISKEWEVLDFDNFDSNNVNDVDALITTAENFDSPKFPNATEYEWNDLLENWLGKATKAVKTIAPSMVDRKNGNIILLSPDYRRLSGDNILAATAAGTLHGFIKSLGIELAVNNVLANCIWAELPFDEESLTDMVFFMAEKNTYISAQVIALKGAV